MSSCLTPRRGLPVPGFLGAALGAALFPLTAADASAGEAAAVRATLDVRYHPGRDRQTLDVFAPQGAKEAPVVLFAHGGTWMGGDKDLFGLYRGVGRFLARHGVVAVLVNYRLSPAVRHPEHVKDLARAFAWTRRHAREFGGDSDCIFLSGHSAGGHLAALLATDETYLKDPLLGLKDADRAALRGVMAVSGVYHIPSPDEFAGLADGVLQGLLMQTGLGENLAPSATALLLQAGRRINPFRLVFGDDRKVCRLASPLAHVRPGLPPLLLLYAEAELPLLADMARDFARSLRGQGNAVELHEVPGRSHANIVFHLDEGDAAGRALLDFVARHAGARH
jgi:acetyl esterase/lipase